MSGQEITVAVAERLSVLGSFNDQAYSMIKHGHRLVGKELADINFFSKIIDRHNHIR